MKRWSNVLMALVMAYCLAVPATADVIWEPENNFYEAHRDECEYEGRQYQLAAYEGSVALRTKPDGLVQATVKNGITGEVQFIWQDGQREWGYLCWVGEERAEGWAPMDDLSLIYDSQQFMEENESDIVESKPVEVDFHQAWLYDYPGGPAGYVLEEDEQYQPFSEMFTTLYTDENGLRWGYVGYYMGHRNRWICLDDPMNENLDTNIMETQPSAAQLKGAPTIENGVGSNSLMIAAVLVAAVVVLTLFLIRKFHPKKENRSEP